MTTDTNPTQHCQICARPIKVVNGVIAHHGYTRPGDGWQTASCMGAKFAPYEVSCERIKVAIEAVKTHIAEVEGKIKDLLTNPPASFIETDQSHFARIKHLPLRVFEKPDNFNAKKEVAETYRYPSSDYGKEFSNLYRKLGRDAEGSKQTLAYLEVRLASWVKAN